MKNDKTDDVTCDEKKKKLNKKMLTSDTAVLDNFFKFPLSVGDTHKHRYKKKTLVNMTIIKKLLMYRCTYKSLTST